MERNVRLEGKYVIVEEVRPKYFEKIIEWRNSPEFNKFLNQPYKLTMELQEKWYEKYLEDNTQGLFIVVDKTNNKPFATMGFTDWNTEEKVLISGRLLVGEIEYRGCAKWIESVQLINDYFYNTLDVNIIYAHIVEGNVASEKWHKKWGFVENTNKIRFRSELIVNGMEQKEYFRDKSAYMEILRKMS